LPSRPASPSHFGAATGAGVEQAVLLLGLATVQFGQTQVMVASLEDGEGRAPAQRRLHRVGQLRQIVVDQLVLQGQGGGRDHDRTLDQQGRHEVGQRLAGPGAGLHQQVLVLGHGIRDGGRHRLLARAFRAAGDRAHRDGEELLDRGRGLCAGHDV
jgi:hypothetical protein